MFWAVVHRLTPTMFMPLALGALCLQAAVVEAQIPANPPQLRIAIVIDDLGNQLRLGRQAIDLPGPVAMSFLPHTPFARRLATTAHLRGKEVLLHLPMQAAESLVLPGPGAITLDQSRHQFATVLAADLQSIPHVSGINNHMGSLLTRHPGHMGWLMEELKQRPHYFFLDSYTTHLSVALQIAREFDVPALKRDVFLDQVVTEEAMERELERLKNLAREQGFAIGIGHPFRETLAFLADQLPLLERQGFTLVPVRSLLSERARQKANSWHAYSSP